MYWRGRKYLSSQHDEANQNHENQTIVVERAKYFPKYGKLVIILRHVKLPVRVHRMTVYNQAANQRHLNVRIFVI